MSRRPGQTGRWKSHQARGVSAVPSCLASSRYRSVYEGGAQVRPAVLHRCSGRCTMCDQGWTRRFRPLWGAPIPGISLAATLLGEQIRRHGQVVQERLSAAGTSALTPCTSPGVNHSGSGVSGLNRGGRGIGPTWQRCRSTRPGWHRSARPVGSCFQHRRYWSPTCGCPTCRSRRSCRRPA
jgi:hypothetical protein